MLHNKERRGWIYSFVGLRVSESIPSSESFLVQVLNQHENPSVLKTTFFAILPLYNERPLRRCQLLSALSMKLSMTCLLLFIIFTNHTTRGIFLSKRTTASITLDILPTR
ncbi:hypothetical protein PMIN06_002427 [Paraphaeosphaeria minitans]